MVLWSSKTLWPGPVVRGERRSPDQLHTHRSSDTAVATACFVAYPPPPISRRSAVASRKGRVYRRASESHPVHATSKAAVCPLLVANAAALKTNPLGTRGCCDDFPRVLQLLGRCCFRTNRLEAVGGGCCADFLGELPPRRCCFSNNFRIAWGGVTRRGCCAATSVGYCRFRAPPGSKRARLLPAHSWPPQPPTPRATAPPLARSRPRLRGWNAPSPSRVPPGSVCML